MDPCPFVRLIVESLALKLPPVPKIAVTGVHASSTPCFCSIRLQDCPAQTAPLPLAFGPTSSGTNIVDVAAATSASSSRVVINLDPAALQKMSGRPAILTVAVYAGRSGKYSCALASGRRLLGQVRVAVDLEGTAERAAVVQSGWVSMGSGQGAARLHLVVRTEPDPRFVFQFGSEPECSPVVYQIQGAGGSSGIIRQPVFSCRFSADSRRTDRSSPLQTKIGVQRCFFGSFPGEGENERREQRKGWTVTIHDLSGSPVAAASVVTPFVPSPGSDLVSRSNPGAWLILRAVGSSTGNWKPWGRLEAWRERGSHDSVGYSFELVPNACNSATESSSSISVRRGGEFRIDAGINGGGFVMATAAEGQGKVSRPTVQVAAKHVACMADVALFVALSAAVDLSMDACQPFSQKLRRELCQQQQRQEQWMWKIPSVGDRDPLDAVAQAVEFKYLVQGAPIVRRS